MSDLLGMYLEYCAPLLGSTRYNKWSFLTVVSALLERRVYIDLGRLGILFPNVYTFLVGAPATGKGFSIGTAMDFYTNVRGNPLPLRGPTKITQAALYEQLVAAKRTVRMHNKKPYSTCPLFLCAEELGQALEDFGGGLLTNELIDFYDSKATNAVVKKLTISGGLLELPNPSITFLAGTTPDFLQQADNNRIIGYGLSSRVFYVVENGSVKKQYADVKVDHDLRKRIVSRLEAIYKLKGVITLTPEARALYQTQGELAHAMSQDSLAAFYKNFYGRKPMHILKLATVYAASELKLVVTAEHIQRAVDEINAIEADMSTAFGVRSIEKDQDAAAQVLQCIPDEPTWISRASLFANLFMSGKFMPDNGVFMNSMKSFKEMGLVKERSAGNATMYTKVPGAIEKFRKRGIIDLGEPQAQIPTAAMQRPLQGLELETAQSAPDEQEGG